MQISKVFNYILWGMQSHSFVAKKLGEQCYYHETCEYTDQHSSCIQIHHNAICQCQNGYHSVSIQKPSKKIFCAEGKIVLALIRIPVDTNNIFRCTGNNKRLLHVRWSPLGYRHIVGPHLFRAASVQSKPLRLGASQASLRKC